MQSCDQACCRMLHQVSRFDTHPAHLFGDGLFTHQHRLPGGTQVNPCGWKGGMERRSSENWGELSSLLDLCIFRLNLEIFINENPFTGLMIFSKNFQFWLSICTRIGVHKRSGGWVKSSLRKSSILWMHFQFAHLIFIFFVISVNFSHFAKLTMWSCLHLLIHLFMSVFKISKVSQKRFHLI
jgi:hypothetical protein